MSNGQQFWDNCKVVLRFVVNGPMAIAVLASTSFLAIVIIVAKGGETAVDVIKAVGGLGTLAAAGAVVWGFQYTRDSIDSQNAKTDLEHQSRLSDHYFRCCSELSSGNEQLRIAAAYALGELAAKHKDFYVQTVHVLATFIKSRSREVRGECIASLQEDVDFSMPMDSRAALTALLSLARIDETRWLTIQGNLDEAVITAFAIEDVKLQNWSMSRAILIDVYIIRCDLAHISLNRSLIRNLNVISSKLQWCFLTETVIENVNMRFAQISYTGFRGCRWSGLTIGNYSFTSDEIDRRPPFQYCWELPLEIEQCAEKLAQKIARGEEAMVSVAPEDGFLYRTIEQQVFRADISGQRF